MPLYLCRWPNGDFSAVNADNKKEAIERLDEVAWPDKSMLVECPCFMVHFKLSASITEETMDSATPPFYLEDFGDLTNFALWDLYPEYSKVFDVLFDNDKVPTETALSLLNQALAIVKGQWEKVAALAHDGPQTVE